MNTSGRKPSGFVSLLLLLAGVLLFWMSVPNLGTAARAATADGPRGTFTAARLMCFGHAGHTTCEWTGTFRSDDGTVELEGVKLYGSGRDTFEAGQTAPAVDVGHAGRVYSPTGSHAWIITAVLAVLAYILFAVVARRHLTPPPLPREKRSSPPTIREGYTTDGSSPDNGRDPRETASVPLPSPPPLGGHRRR
ncbi:hypothetical protein [Streptomyces griseomycini]|uniref:Transmembrane protein n=1 Tax=Streptomyces griseomycini TaxID=66895 RepID=A0A7W7PV69_9ACTN|nr:hypothetical protein [Streptomyces griseomycini]MBB4901895.1 hypothetical protein [Streptomyces griseomycini]GGQ17476.1 hypothetical protein GCM10010266_45720 [Streptomyces griseomycini]GGR41068.1 hypothetical protein GCM10015536_53530 [Streptomyces griseomycini]